MNDMPLIKSLYRMVSFISATVKPLKRIQRNYQLSPVYRPSPLKEVDFLCLAHLRTGPVSTFVISEKLQEPNALAPFCSRRRSSIIEITGNNSEWSGSDDDQEDDTEEEGDMEIDEDSSMESLDSPDDYNFI